MKNTLLLPAVLFYAAAVSTSLSQSDFPPTTGQLELRGRTNEVFLSDPRKEHVLKRGLIIPWEVDMNEIQMTLSADPIVMIVFRARKFALE